MRLLVSIKYSVCWRQLVPFYDQLRGSGKKKAAWEFLDIMKEWTMYMAESFECVFDKKDERDRMGEREFGRVYLTFRPDDILIVDPSSHVLHLPPFRN